MKMSAVINRIIEFSNVDGPGNRMTIFFQNCPFKCLYCHNPETINYCINCGDCINTCPVNALTMVDGKVVWNEDVCVNCDTCLKTCKHLSSPKVKVVSVEDVMGKILKIKDFINGITVSGGECMSHVDFLKALFKEVRKLGLTCFVDSNGAYLFENYPELVEVMDYVMLDVKAFDKDKHKWLCGVNNDAVLKNLAYLQKIDKLYEVRTVMLPNNPELNEETLRNVISHLNPDIRYKLIKYRPFGVREEGLEVLGNTITSDQEIERLVDIAKKLGHKNIIVV